MYKIHMKNLMSSYYFSDKKIIQILFINLGNFYIQIFFWNLKNTF